jgi:DNA-binding transcriptional LysR family regulator
MQRPGLARLVCVGSRRYFEQRGVPRTPADLVDHNCLLYAGLREAADWPFVGPEGPFSVRVHGDLSSNSVVTIRAAVLAGLGIGLSARILLADELSHPDVITILDDFVSEVRDISLVWPKRRLIPARVRRATEFFAEAIPKRL